jgi:hypothetical protein
MSREYCQLEQKLRIKTDNNTLKTLIKHMEYIDIC